MSKKINLKQIILVVAILLLMVIFVVLLMDVFLNKMDYTSNEDINLSFVAVIVEVIFVFPYFVALIILLHGGYYALKSTPFSTAKCLHCISAGITLVSILSYELLYLGICFYDIYNFFIIHHTLSHVQNIAFYKIGFCNLFNLVC